MNTKVLLKYLDSPIRFLSFSLQDFILYCAPFFIGVFFDSILIVPLSGYIILYFIKKALKPLPKFFLMRYMYWAIPTKKYQKLLKVVLPPSSKRLWVK